jgi:uncharacterized protein YbaR (Trm112 family)
MVVDKVHNVDISKELLKILVCPITKGRLLYDKENSLLVSPNVELGFPIVDGIPILLKDEAVSVTSERIKKLLKEQELLETQVS